MAIGSIKLASLFLTLPTRVLTGLQVISADGLIASVLGKQPRPERHEVGGFKFMQRRFPNVRAHDHGATLADAKGRLRHGIAPFAAFMFANVEPPLNSLLDGSDLGAARPGGHAPTVLSRAARSAPV